MFFLIFAAVLSIGCLYISLRLIPRTSLKGWPKALAYALCFTPLLNVPARHMVRSMARAGETVPAWLDVTLYATYILIGSLSVVAVVVFACDMLLLAKYLYRRLRKPSCDVKAQPAPAVMQGRRLFLQNSLSAGLVAVGGSLVSYGVSEAVGMPQIKHISVPIKNLPKPLHGYTIAQLTDIHINKPVPATRLENIVANINALKPDAVVITGDISDSFPEQVHAEMEPLRALDSKDGTFFVSGNHEYYTSIDAWLDEVARLGITNLHNEHRVIERDGARLLMCGVPDITAPRMSDHISDPVLAQQGSMEGDIKVLLAHQPQSIYAGSTVNYHLQISGHTHGGQLFPWTYVTDLVQPYIHGLYKVENTQLYVSRGTGYWGPPIRIGAPAEVAFLHLVPA